jgi:putative FmdB family regulatory protein
VPAYEYRCGVCCRRTEEFFPVAERQESVGCPYCGGEAKRILSRFTISGPIHMGLDAINSQLLSTRDRRNGREIRTKSQMEARERELGVRRMTVSEYRETTEAETEDARAIRAAGREGGREAALDYIDKIEVKDATGWTDAQYVNWKARTDAATSALDRGDVRIPDADGVPG